MMNGLETSASLKSLNVTKSKLQRRISEWKKEIHNAESGIKEAEKSLEDIEQRISDIQNNSEVSVSEHALLRYLQRFTDIDLNQIQEVIKNMPVEQVVKRGNTIVTLIDRNDGNS